MPINLSTPKNKFPRKFVIAQRELLIIFSALLALAISWIFPVSLIGESFFASLVLLLLFPLVIIIFLLKEPLKNYGLQWGDQKKGLILSAVFVIIFILIDYLVVRTPSLRNQLSIFPGIAFNFWIFLWFELIISLSLHFVWEFFFRGFLQLGLEKKSGYMFLFVQALLQSLFVFRNSWLMIGLVFISALGAGYIARQSRSIIYSFASMWIISISLDIMIIKYITNQIHL